MNIDPTINVVAFRFGGSDEVAVADTPARNDDSVRRAWWRVILEHRSLADDVTAIDCRWEPSDADKEFLGRAFHNLQKLEFTFKRPAPDEWEKAFTQARQVITKHPKENPEAHVLPGRPIGVKQTGTAEDGDPHAAFRLGVQAMERGDRAEAEKWHRQAAGTGYIKAMTSLGNLLEDGGRLDEAADWYQRADRARNALAANHLRKLLGSAGHTTEV